jgi:hypothetical protein
VEHIVEHGIEAAEVAEMAGGHGVGVVSGVRMTMEMKEVGVEKGEEPGSSRPPESQRGQTETS